MTNPLPNVDDRFGAPMGRRSTGDTPSDPCRLFRVHIDSGGYDSGGAYWGIGGPLYCAFNDEACFAHFTRAMDRKSAAKYFARKFPGIRWVRKP